MISVPDGYKEALVVIQRLLLNISVLEYILEKAEARAEKAEARVAELEKRVEKYQKKPTPDPITPSGMTLPYEKPNRKKGYKKKPGRKKGYSGARRKEPE